MAGGEDDRKPAARTTGTLSGRQGRGGHHRLSRASGLPPNYHRLDRQNSYRSGLIHTVRNVASNVHRAAPHTTPSKRQKRKPVYEGSFSYFTGQGLKGRKVTPGKEDTGGEKKKRKRRYKDYEIGKNKRDDDSIVGESDGEESGEDSYNGDNHDNHDGHYDDQEDHDDGDSDGDENNESANGGDSESDDGRGNETLRRQRSESF